MYSLSILLRGGMEGVIRLIQKQEIILKHRQGISNRKIALELHIDKNTVNKYVAAYDEELEKLHDRDPDAAAEQLAPGIIEKPQYDTSNRDKSDRVKAVIPIIKQCLEENARKRETGRYKQQMRKIGIYDYLKKKGYQVSYSTVLRLIEEIEPSRKEAFIHQEYGPGAQTEFDWGEVKLDIGGMGYLKYQMAVFTSSYGNHRFARLYRTQDTAAFQESHADYFAFCKGVFRKVVYDNMKVAVRTFVGPTEKEPTEALLELSAYYGFSFRFCNVRRGNEKPHVERSVDVVRHFAFSEPGDDVFNSLEEANEHLLKKCVELNQSPLSDGRIPEQVFREEKNYLMANMPKMPCFMKRTELKVSKYSTVQVNKVHYSVPDKYVGKKVAARIYTWKVEIYNGSEKIASHSRHYKGGEYVIDIFHYLHTLGKKPGALPQSSALMQSDARIKKIYETYYTTDPKEFLHVLELINENGVEPVEKALKKLEGMVTSDFSAAKVRLVHDAIVQSENPPLQPGEDRISRKSGESLKQYDELRAIQSRRAG